MGFYNFMVKLYLVLIAMKYDWSHSVASQGPDPVTDAPESTTVYLGPTAVQCSYDSDCQFGFSCTNHKCRYTDRPCVGVCGVNADCHLLGLLNLPLCTCRTGYRGNPLVGCSRSAERACRSHDSCALDQACVSGVCVDPCQGACGLNTDCKVAAHRAVCLCKQGFSWSDTKGCYPDEIPECNSNWHCSSDKACLRQRCVDPCEGLCGKNTVCKVVDHYPACACRQGYNGDPFQECKPLCLTYLKELASTTRPTSPPPPPGPIATTSESYPYSDATTRSNAKRYLVSTEKRNWTDALNYCASINMSLVAIENYDEQAALENFLQSSNYSGDLWTSGKRLSSGELFQWTSSGNLISYFNWESGHPLTDIDRTKNCIELRPRNSFKWATFRCDYKQHFVCQF